MVPVSRASNARPYDEIGLVSIFITLHLKGLILHLQRDHAPHPRHCAGKDDHLYLGVTVAPIALRPIERKMCYMLNKKEATV